MEKQFCLDLNGKCRPGSIVQGDKYRFTILTSQMLRMEYSETGEFEDAPTQVVWNRDFETPPFTVRDQEGRLEIDTEYFHLVYDKKEFSPNHLYIDVKYAFTNYGGRWYYGRTDYGDPLREHNLKGTARTLDRCDGEWFEGSNPLERMRTRGGNTNRGEGDVDLGMGLCDTSGRTFFDDSESLLMDADGWVHPRKKGCIDTYFFGYGRDYFKAIHDFYRLSGPVPMLPKYVLGNWWSRYWKYTEESYRELLERFERENIPFSVVVMDMDWHLVDIPEKFGKGWTGYTWNKECFPDPEGFMKWLHAHHYRITLNLHPADGVRAYEENYPEMAQAMNVDQKTGYPVLFDFTDPAFVQAYFKFLHHPNEKQGVDFWWMDWQQGKISAIEGMDPIWMLNHYHHFDLTRTGKRGVMLSRYSGLGSHRYPIGFSGDTHVTWKSLQYQPYFTATAANVGYTWWSHDIGGHMNGIKDNELYVRWLQYGVFSPINRLHSNSNPFCGKEPWRYPKPYDEIARSFLRLRHRLMPYIYTMNAQCHEKMVPVVVPAYYYFPMEEGSYVCRNEYFFGTELLIQPMVHPTDPETGYTTERSWIPQGNWYDIDNGKVYHGGKKGRYGTISRPIDRQGVLAKAGAIVPMAPEPDDNTLENPKRLEILIFPGENNVYTLYEDAGDGFEYEKGAFFKTEISLKWEEDKVQLIIRPEGDVSVVPQKRQYVLKFRGIADVGLSSASEDMTRYYDSEKKTVVITTEFLETGREVCVTLPGAASCTKPGSEEETRNQIFQLLDQIQGSIVKKKNVYQYFKDGYSKEEIVSALMGMEISESWKILLMEMLTC